MLTKPTSGMIAQDCTKFRIKNIEFQEFFSFYIKDFNQVAS